MHLSKEIGECDLGKFPVLPSTLVFRKLQHLCLEKVRALHPVKSLISRSAEYLQELIPILVVTHPILGISFKNQLP